jgi:hypothetical protein
MEMPVKTYPPIDIKNYSVIKEHLDTYWSKIKNREDQGVTTYNLRSCAYMDEFSKQKIIWGEISDKPKFAFDSDGKYYPEATTFTLTGEKIGYLFLMLNAKISEWFFSKIGTTTGVGTVRWKKFTIEQLLVAPPDIDTLHKTENIIEGVKNHQIGYKDFEKETNSIINALYNFDKNEINFIERYSK